MENTNRKWQKHLKSKGIIPFFLDRLQSHALQSDWQYKRGSFEFPIVNREEEDELTKLLSDINQDKSEAPEETPEEVVEEVDDTEDWGEWNDEDWE